MFTPVRTLYNIVNKKILPANQSKRKSITNYLLKTFCGLSPLNTIHKIQTITFNIKLLVKVYIYIHIIYINIHNLLSCIYGL